MAGESGGFDGWREAAEAARMSLHSLTPAECLVLLDPKGADPKELIRVTLLDLIAKKAIGFERRERRTLIRKKKVDEPYLIAGQGVRHRNAKDHEWLMLDVMRQEVDVSLKKFAREVAYKLGKARRFKESHVALELSKAGLAVKERRLVVFRRIRLTEKGERVRDVLTDLRRHAERQMDGWLSADREKAALFLALVGANILIMPELMEKLETAFSPAGIVSANATVGPGPDASFDGLIPDGFSESFSDACDAVRFDGGSFDACFDSLGSGAFDGGSGGGDGGGGGGDGGGGGGD